MLAKKDKKENSLKIIQGLLKISWRSFRTYLRILQYANVEKTHRKIPTGLIIEISWLLYDVKATSGLQGQTV